MIHPNTFKSACNSCRRQKIVDPLTGKIKQKAGAISWLLNEVPPRTGSPYQRSETELVDSDATKIPTACWQWDEGAGRHRISVGNRLDEAFHNPLIGPSAKFKPVEVIKAAIAHEVCHAAYTDGVRHEVDAALKKNKLKFRFHNLVEDCRIEWRYLKERGKEHRFNWNRWDETGHMTKPTSVASTLLWQLKSREPALFKSISSAMAPLTWEGLSEFITGPYRGQPMKSVIRKFYERFVNAKTELELIPIEKEWVDLFGHDVEAYTGIASVDESGGKGAAAAGGGEDEGESAVSAPVAVAATGGSSSSTPKVQTNFAYPGDRPHDPASHLEGLSPLTHFMG